MFERDAGIELTQSRTDVLLARVLQLLLGIAATGNRQTRPRLGRDHTASATQALTIARLYHRALYVGDRGCRHRRRHLLRTSCENSGQTSDGYSDADCRPGHHNLLLAKQWRRARGEASMLNRLKHVRKRAGSCVSPTFTRVNRPRSCRVMLHNRRQHTHRHAHHSHPSRSTDQHCQ